MCLVLARARFAFRFSLPVSFLYVAPHLLGGIKCTEMSEDDRRNHNGKLYDLIADLI